VEALASFGGLGSSHATPCFGAWLRSSSSSKISVTTKLFLHRERDDGRSGRRLFVNQEPTPLSSSPTDTERQQCHRRFGDVLFQVATWNVNRLPNNVQERMEAIVEEIGRHHNNADIQAHDSTNSQTSLFPLIAIGFQEVTCRSWRYLEAGLRQLGYNHFVWQQPYEPTGIFCGLALMSAPLNSRDSNINSDYFDVEETGWYEFKHGPRGLCHAKLRFRGGRKLLVATSHFASFENGTNQRRLQLLETEAFCKNQLQQDGELDACTVMADFNWDDEQRDEVCQTPPADPTMSQILEIPFLDAAAPACTWDSVTWEGKATTTLTRYFGITQGLRLDRILVFARSQKELGTFEVRIQGLLKGFWTASDDVDCTFAATDHYGPIAAMTWLRSHSNALVPVRRILRRGTLPCFAFHETKANRGAHDHASGGRRLVSEQTNADHTFRNTEIPTE